MAHYNAHDSFKTKKSVEKKQRAKQKAFGKSQNFDENFIIKSSDEILEEFGTVIEVKYNEAEVLYNDEIVTATLRKDIDSPCNKVIFPGDKVILNENFVVQNLLKRTTMLTRIKKDRTRIDDIGTTLMIAANINLAVIVVSAKEPPLHPKFIDRYLMIVQNSGIEAVICLNKCDLKTEEEERILNIYRNIGVPVVETSAFSNIGIEDLKMYLKNKQAIFVGNSGVGKSTLTNAIMESNEIKTSHVSEKSGRGRHTTTSSKYYVWDENSSIIDTPGIRSLDVSSFDPIEIQDYFPEFSNWKGKCKYNDCLHYNEPIEDCLIQQGVNSGLINADRYNSYIRIIENLTGEKKTNLNDIGVQKGLKR